MSDLKFDFYSKRSMKARIGVKFGKMLVAFLVVLAFALLFFGGLLVYFGFSFGWALIGFSVMPAMTVEWYNGELHHMKIAKNPKTVDDILSADILGRLSHSPTPKDLVDIIYNVSGGQFIAVRFGISRNFLKDLVSNNKDDMQAIWQEAWDIWLKTGSKNMSAVVLLVSIIKLSPNYKTLISHLQLDINDLMNGINWFNHLQNLIEQSRRPRKTGGLARDWSFGWTPLLNRFGQNISQQVGDGSGLLFKLEAHNEALDKLIDIFGGDGRQNVVLVGASGVGKTEIVRAFASKLLDATENIPSNLRFRQIFILDSSALISAAPGRGELEQLMNQILDEAYATKNAIICLDNAQLFFEDSIGSVDITNILLPVLKAGRIRMILTMDEQKYLKINKRTPELTSLLNRVVVSPATRDETIMIMQDRLIDIEIQNQTTFMYQSLDEIYQLSDRYVYDMAMPGKAISLLESTAHYGENGFVTPESVRKSVEKTLDIKVDKTTDEDERAKLLNLEDLIHERMIGQDKAVQAVSNALRRARAGVRSKKRPIGTFLFLGPTGVGKTELAKALANIYFGGDNKIIRLDMNGYTNNSDVKRLIDDTSDSESSLTAKVMKQPFSVVLFDEIEKAHDNVIEALLQLLDEGILRDGKNREVSFRDSIIIATSNAGADRIREYIDRGYNIDQFEDKFIDELINTKQFKPEFINRFDEVVMFKPLVKSELLQIVDLMIMDINKTLESQKISVSVTNSAKEHLVDFGNDPKLGARPMRRIVQRAVENTIAKQMLSGKVKPGDVIEIDLDQVKKILD